MAGPMRLTAERPVAAHHKETDRRVNEAKIKNLVPTDAALVYTSVAEFELEGISFTRSRDDEAFNTSSTSPQSGGKLSINPKNRAKLAAHSNAGSPPLIKYKIPRLMDIHCSENFDFPQMLAP